MRFSATLAVLSGVMALLAAVGGSLPWVMFGLAMAGVYGSLAWSVQTRQDEVTQRPPFRRSRGEGTLGPVTPTARWSSRPGDRLDRRATRGWRRPTPKEKPESRA